MKNTTYQSKKDETIFAVVEREEEKYGTTLLIYTSGPNSGKSFSLTNSTLKRWWKIVSVSESENPLNIDLNKVAEPYKPDVTPHYVKKPESVINYEESKKTRKTKDLPTLDTVVEDLGAWLNSINELSNYVKFKNDTTLWVKHSAVDIYATEAAWSRLTEAGFMSKPNKDKVRPFAFKLTTMEEYKKSVKALSFE